MIREESFELLLSVADPGSRPGARARAGIHAQAPGEHNAQNKGLFLFSSGPKGINLNYISVIFFIIPRISLPPHTVTSDVGSKSPTF